jgi:hypothetical protein
MRLGQLAVCLAAAIGMGLAWPRTVVAADSFRKLKDREIKARLAGMEITDRAHWAEQYLRDGSYRAFHMGQSLRRANGTSAVASCAWMTVKPSRTAEKYGCPAARSSSVAPGSKAFCRGSRNASEPVPCRTP